MEWPDFTATPGCQCDYLVVNNIAQIPAKPLDLSSHRKFDNKVFPTFFPTSHIDL
jgi:hypothetical protein